MERSEKRRLDRERQKLQKHNLKEDQVNRDWYSSLPVSKKIFIGKFIERQAIKNDNLVAMIMDKCILGAIDDNTDLSEVLMKKIIKEGNDYILEYKEYLDKYGDGGFDMIENKKLRDEVKTKIRGYLKEGKQKNKAMTLLKKEFNLPNAELSDLWISCRAEGTRDEKNIQTALEYEAKKEVVVDKESLVIKNDDKVLEVPKGAHTTSKLRVVNVVRDIQGEYGLYTVSKNGVYIDGKNYKDIDEANKENDKLYSDYNENVNDIKRKIEELNQQLKICGEVEADRVKRYIELKEVFNS